MGVPPVRPEQQQPVELGLDVRELGLALGEDPEQASLFLEGQNQCQTTRTTTTNNKTMVTPSPKHGVIVTTGGGGGGGGAGAGLAPGGPGGVEQRTGSSREGERLPAEGSGKNEPQENVCRRDKGCKGER